MDVSIIILTLVFLAMFLVPFLTISIMQKVKEHKKRRRPIQKHKRCKQGGDFPRIEGNEWLPNKLS